MLVPVKETWQELQLVAEGTKKLLNMPAIHGVCNAIGYPVFARTDKMAAKHSWNSTCYVATENDLDEHIASLVDHTLNCDMIGKMVDGIAIREYIEMESSFTAFDGLPISRERRYFARDGEVECHHPYWQEDAIRFTDPASEPPNWREFLSGLNYESFDEIDTLTRYAEKIAAVLEGYWSIDFCRCKTKRGQPGKWYFIDCALGTESWHPECECYF